MTEQFTFFWHGPFSQFHKAPMTIDDITYGCAEQYMMASKAAFFGDFESHRLIMETFQPKIMKALGRKVKNFHGPVWSAKADGVVRRASYEKFTQNRDLRDLLLSTEGTTLVEASPYDKIWGIGLIGTDPRAKDRRTWRGENRLGQILTETRDFILSELVEKGWV